MKNQALENVYISYMSIQIITLLQKRKMCISLTDQIFLQQKLNKFRLTLTGAFLHVFRVCVKQVKPLV